MSDSMSQHCPNCEAQAAEIERLREALRTIENGSVKRPVGNSWFLDGRPSKHDQCIHGIWMYKPCEGCTDAFIAEALEGKAEQ